MGGLFAKFRGSRSGSRKSKGENQDGNSKSKKQKQSKKTVNLPESQSARKIVDPRLPFSNYRQIFSIRNAWKAVARTMEDCAKENLIRLFHAHPVYKRKYDSIKNMSDEDEMRKDEDFENVAMDIFQVFDDVIANLEEVDKALRDIQLGAQNINLTKTMFKNMQTHYIETVRTTLGPERFPEVTENNFVLLYGFIDEKISVYLDDDDPEPEPEPEPKVEQEPESETVVEEKNNDNAIDNAVTETDVEVNLCTENGV